MTNEYEEKRSAALQAYDRLCEELASIDDLTSTEQIAIIEKLAAIDDEFSI